MDKFFAGFAFIEFVVFVMPGVVAVGAAAPLLNQQWLAQRLSDAYGYPGLAVVAAVVGIFLIGFLAASLSFWLFRGVVSLIEDRWIAAEVKRQKESAAVERGVTGRIQLEAMFFREAAAYFRVKPAFGRPLLVLAETISYEGTSDSYLYKLSAFRRLCASMCFISLLLVLGYALSSWWGRDLLAYSLAPAGALVLFALCAWDYHERYRLVEVCQGLWCLRHGRPSKERAMAE